MNKPAIVILAYDRPKSLKRLLQSLTNAHFSEKGITLHISIDKSDQHEVTELAESFEWNHGDKIVEVQSEHLGLKEHVLKCGDLTEKYDAIILLEDDLSVAPHFYNYAFSALNFYRSDEKIAGISLYNYEVAESCGYPFQALNDGSDVYFMQVASSWGQAWSKTQWQQFRTWYQEVNQQTTKRLPSYVSKWGEHSWKKFFINYLIECDTYFVFPQFSYSTNFEDAGTNAVTRDLYQSTLHLSDRALLFTSLNESKAVYDAYFEPTAATINAWTDAFLDVSYSVDLYGAKTLGEISEDLVLTTKSGTNAMRTFSAQLHPLIENVINGIEGNAIHFLNKRDITNTQPASSIFLPSSIVDKVKEAADKIISIGAVIPVSELDHDKLLTTLRSIENNTSNVQCVLSVSSVLADEISNITGDISMQFQLITVDSSDEGTLLKAGLLALPTAVQTWCRPGSTFSDRCFSDVARIVHGFGDIDVLNGLINTALNRTSSENLAHLRWNASMLQQYAHKASKVSSELMFWKSNLIQQALKKESFNANLLTHDLAAQRHIVAIAVSFGTITSSEDESLVKRRQTVKMGAVKKIFGPLFFRWFRRDVKLLRFLFLELEHLPDVIRYNEEGNFFYRSRY